MARILAVSSLAALALGAGVASGAESQLRVDPALPAYRAGANVTGALTVSGSDTMEPLVEAWLTGLRAAHPGLVVKSSALGSESGYLCLLESTCQVGSMSREMSRAEVASFEGKFGYPPTRIAVAVGALAIFVHPSNPIGAISPEQLDAIFSMSRRGGLKEPITSWGQLGLTGEWAARRINAYGRDEHSGTRAFFRDRVLQKGDFRPSVRTIGDPQSMMEAVALDASAIGYGSVGDASSLVKVMALDQAGAPPVAPTVDAIMKGNYPLVRFFYVYVNKTAGKPLPAPVAALLNYALSREGQQAVASAGMIPVPADFARSGLARVQ